MKRSYQLMQIYDIQRDYTRHREKLKSIQHIDPKKKVSPQKNQEGKSIYKKSHSIAHSFLSKQTNKKIQKENDMLYRTLIKQNDRKTNMTLRQSSHSDSSKSLMRNTSLTLKISRIKEENSKIKKKIESTKSNYEHFRKSNTNLQIKNKIDSQQELKRFLQNQFRIKPTVLFPQTTRAKSIEKQQISQNQKKKLLPKFYEAELTKAFTARRQEKPPKNIMTPRNQKYNKLKL